MPRTVDSHAINLKSSSVQQEIKYHTYQPRDDSSGTVVVAKKYELYVRKFRMAVY